MKTPSAFSPKPNQKELVNVGVGLTPRHDAVCRLSDPLPTRRLRVTLLRVLPSARSNLSPKSHVSRASQVGPTSPGNREGVATRHGLRSTLKQPVPAGAARRTPRQLRARENGTPQRDLRDTQTPRSSVAKKMRLYRRVHLRARQKQFDEERTQQRRAKREWQKGHRFSKQDSSNRRSRSR